jgi:hypothetical protein
MKKVTTKPPAPTEDKKYNGPQASAGRVADVSDISPSIQILTYEYIYVIGVSFPTAASGRAN